MSSIIFDIKPENRSYYFA